MKTKRKVPGIGVHRQRSGRLRIAEKILAPEALGVRGGRAADELQMARTAMRQAMKQLAAGDSVAAYRTIE
ncbi:MAG: hypothetical protein ACREFX_09400, partial [Opitutaceae bacterium]